MPIRLIIFDLDGTLVDSSGDITNALNFAIEPFGIEPVTVDKTIGLVGEGLTRLVEKLLGEERAEVKPQVMERFLDHYSGHLTDLTRPYPGVLEALELLRGCRKAVISNKREHLSRRLLEDLGLAGYFEIIWGSDSADERKPSPKPIERMLALMGVSPAEALIVGDSTYDVQAGRAAGISTAAVSYGYRHVSLLRDAEFIVDDLRDLAARLDGCS